MAEKGTDSVEKITETAQTLATDDKSFEQCWQSLSSNQRRYVLARPKHSSKADAARAIGLTPRTIYTWPDEVERAAELFLGHVGSAIQETITEGAAKAALKLIDLVDSDQDGTALQASTYLVDQAIGKATATQKTELSGKVEVEESEVSALRADLLARLDKKEEQ